MFSLRRIPQGLVLCVFAIWIHNYLHSYSWHVIRNQSLDPDGSTTTAMSDKLVDWLRDSLTPLYQIGVDSTEDNLSTRIDNIIEEGARIIHNHELIDKAKFIEGLRVASAAVSKADVEWKEIMSTSGQTSGGEKVNSNRLLRSCYS
ncbi:hypothetical protein NP233_g373 [Leucocoprinus birnbaumii]|uniref:Uncharacterized protein n=1 Tax=Leucocoprinus birnbaumii TaxID=56174 RepID=A0AAD5W293_9AGAR|nr:hypothetical protein NP233_g373 [Leucocoprinus birnbaumii]